MKKYTNAILLIVLVSVITSCGGVTTTPQTIDPAVSAAPTIAPTAERSGDLGELSWVFEAGEPVDVAVVLEANNMVEALIPVEGGSITASGADGSVYTLDIPSDALLNETTIGLTPVASISGMPFGGDQTYAVQLSPDGLFLQNFAILTITPAEELAVDQQIFFDYLQDGKDVILALPVVDSSEIKINVLHFSGYGATNGTAADAGNLGATTERRLSSALAEQLGQDRARQVLGLEDQPLNMEAIRQAWAEYEQQVIQPLIDAAGENCDAGKQAIQTVLSHERDRQILGESNGEGFGQFADLYNKVARGCILENFERCVEYHAWLDMIVAYDNLVQANSSGITAGMYTSGTMSEARDLTIKCVTFRLVFESTATANYQGLANYESSMEAEIFLRYNPGTGFIGGNGEYINTSVTGSSSVGCNISMTPGGGTIVVLSVVPIVELGAPGADGNYPDARIKDLELSYAFGISGEHSTISCPPDILQSGPAATWSLSYYDAHIEELEPGWALRDWEMEYGDLYATKEWDKVGTVTGIATTEAGSFELYHEPGG